MFAVIGAGGLLGALVSSPLRKTVSPRLALVGEAWVIAAVVPLLLIAHAAVLIGLIIAAAEFPTPLSNSIVSGYRVAATPDHLQGRVQAAGTLVTMSLGWLGPLMVGFVFSQGGPTATILLLIGWAFALAIATSLAPALRHDPSKLAVEPAG